MTGDRPQAVMSPMSFRITDASTMLNALRPGDALPPDYGWRRVEAPCLGGGGVEAFKENIRRGSAWLLYILELN